MPWILHVFVLAIGSACAWLINLTGHFAHKSSEQVRLDALTLSLCHHRKNFIEAKILDPNQSLQTTRILMNELAAPCLIAEQSSVGVLSAVCEWVRKNLGILSKRAKSIEARQDLNRSRYPLSKSELSKRLRSDNNLGENAGQIEVRSGLFGIIADGFSREDLAPEERVYENYFQIRWPRRLKTNLSFERLHQVRAKFFPKRRMTGGSLRERKHSLSTYDTQPAKTRASTSTSACEVQEISEQNFRVIRK